MPTVAIVSQKGGSGKTTIATHLARALQLAGADVLLVETIFDTLNAKAALFATGGKCSSCKKASEPRS